MIRSLRLALSGATLLLVVCIHTGISQTFPKFLRTVEQAGDSIAKRQIIDTFIANHPEPFSEDSIVWFYFRGEANVVAVPGDLNEWNPSVSRLDRIPGTDLFYRAETLASDARVEYKVWADSAWMLDPRNPRQALGGYGANSDCWMPRYVPLEYPNAEDIPAGHLDTLLIHSEILKRTHPVIVYVPAGKVVDSLPSVWVCDGSDYIRLAEMTRIMDIELFFHRVRPVVGVFIDPRTSLGDDQTNKRMEEYAPSSAYLRYLREEVQPVLLKRFGISSRPSDKVIVGASLGGLISTYAVLADPGMFSNCGSQSPAYLFGDSATAKLAARAPVDTSLHFFIQTGTIHDTREHARPVVATLRSRGFDVEYVEVPEGHNYTNWRKRLPHILVKFFPIR